MADIEQRIRQNIAAVQQRIAAAAQRAGRDPAAVTLVAVTKTHPADVVRAAMAAGVHDVGENRVQEASEKHAQCTDAPVHWHLIGHLQRNKARRAVEVFDLIHSVDSVRLAETLDRLVAEGVRPASAGRLPILLQINVAGEVQKEGFDLLGGLSNAAQLPGFFDAVAQIVALPQIEVRGLMTVAPYVEQPEQVRSVFRTLRELRDELVQRFPAASWHELSMGMTGDFDVAIEEGATLVRVGRALFGERG